MPSLPRLSKKGTIVIEDLKQARSAIAHSSLFFEIIPKKRKFSPSMFSLGQKPR
jgi:hypothetical protein